MQSTKALTNNYYINIVLKNPVELLSGHSYMRSTRSYFSPNSMNNWVAAVTTGGQIEGKRWNNFGGFDSVAVETQQEATQTK